MTGFADFMNILGVVVARSRIVASAQKALRDDMTIPNRDENAITRVFHLEFTNHLECVCT